ncbi:MAG: hypothetical protein K2N72_00495 [Oscillospiraceae bacterium]|nr:hypothetical protein [Oscillospiraceae bacterium]
MCDERHTFHAAARKGVHAEAFAEPSPLFACIIGHCLFGCRFTLFAPVSDFALMGGSMKRTAFAARFYAAPPPDVGCQFAVTLQCMTLAYLTPSLVVGRRFARGTLEMLSVWRLSEGALPPVPRKGAALDPPKAPPLEPEWRVCVCNAFVLL